MHFFHFILLLFVFRLHGLDINLNLSLVPNTDKENIEKMFTELMIQDHFAYTLFGTKPVSLSSHFTLTPWENTIEHLVSDGVFWKRWESWEKYNYLFPSQHYLILKEKSWAKNFNIFSIIIINKRAFIKIIDENLELFSSILNKKINSRQVLKDIENGKIGFIETINNNQILWGILLGYGKCNAFLYAKNDQPYLWSLSLINNPLLKNCNEVIPGLSNIKPVCFVGNPDHPETIHLKNKYKKTRKKILSIYNTGHFFENTLKKLTE